MVGEPHVPEFDFAADFRRFESIHQRRELPQPALGNGDRGSQLAREPRSR